MNIGAISFSEASRLKADGARVLDTRTADAFASGHWQDSVNIGFNGNLTGWTGRLIEPDEGIVLVAPKGREQSMLGRLSGQKVLGWIDGGIGAVPESQIGQMARTTPEELAQQLKGESPPSVLDVRTPREFADGHIAGAYNIPLDQLEGRVDELPEAPLVVNCRSGYRSSAAVSLLASLQAAVATDLVGGISAWMAAGLPVERA
jgi:hydroxyacylglutathione hydrolase